MRVLRTIVMLVAIVLASVSAHFTDSVANAEAMARGAVSEQLSQDRVATGLSIDIQPLSTTAVALAAGGAHTCALTPEGGVRCWGRNVNAALGDGTTTDRWTPVDVAGLTSGIKAIAAGERHTCALTAAGGVKCWGWNPHGALGDGTTTMRLMPVDVSGLASGVRTIAAAYMYTCALTTAGGVKCWGYNGSGNLGDGTSVDRSTPVDVVGLGSGVQTIAAGGSFACALMLTGGVKCWGAAYAPQAPVEISGLPSGIQTIAVGSGHACVLTGEGEVSCWGYNDFGQLGDGTNVDRWTPTAPLTLNKDVRAIATGGGHTCAIMNSGGMKCWGYNNFGQVGDGTTNERWTPTAVAGITQDAVLLSVGEWHSCALISTGGIKCWGHYWFGQLGNGASMANWTPVGVSDLANGVRMISSDSHYTCAVTTDGGAYCWGYNDGGQLGDGTTRDRWAPKVVTGLDSGVEAIGTGFMHVCVLTTAGGVKCWGQNWYGQLGDGTTTEHLTPVDVTGLESGVQAIAVGSVHSCALTIAGEVKCWGANDGGELGDGTQVDRPIPVTVTALGDGVQAIAAGGGNACALVLGGGAKCWGYNHFGEVGDGTDTDRYAPVDVVGLASGVQSISVGTGYSCALIATGDVKCWGKNEYGQLGDGTKNTHLSPVDVADLGDVQTITASVWHTCAVMAAGGVKCWGYNQFGQLGNHSLLDSLAPVDVLGLVRPAQAIASGDAHSCVLMRAGDVACWGMSEVGELGSNPGWIPVDAAWPLQVPAFTSVPVAIAFVGLPYSYTVAAAGTPTPFYTLPAKPAGMKIDGVTGDIQWQPVSSGDVAVTVEASNGVEPAARQAFTIHVLTPQAPLINSAPITVAVPGELYRYDVDASGSPTPTYTLLVSPPGMNIDSASGVIEWMPAAVGDVTVAVSASNGATPAAVQEFTVAVAYAPRAPRFTSTPIFAATNGWTYTYTVVAAGYPAPAFRLSKAPPGMTIDAGTGVIAWTPTALGDYEIIVEAANGVDPAAEQAYTLTVVSVRGFAPLLAR